MDELIKLLTARTGLPDDKARIAIETVVGFLKQHMPGPMAEQLNAVISTAPSEGLAEKVKGMAQTVGNVFTKKAG